MPRPIWKGHISFGLVYIPISLYSGEKDTGLRFHLVDKRDQSRLRYERINESTGKKVSWDQVAKAFEYEKDQYVIMEEEDFKQAAVENSQTINIENFVDEEAIDYRFFEKPYFLIPENKGEKGYVILREALKRSKKVGIAKVVIRSRQYLAAVLPFEDALILDLMRFPDELLNAKDFNLPSESLKTYKITPNEIKIAEQLIAAMSTEWQPHTYHDDYREALLNFIEQKEKGLLPARKKTARKPKGKVIDFMALMKESIKEQKRPKKGAKATKITKQAA